MLACAFALTLLAIVAGMMLLAQTKKENLGNIYKYVSWFVIVCGFLSILAIGARSAMKCCPMMREHRMMMREGRMMDGCMMGHMGGYGMMGCHREMMGGCGMMNNGCCEGMNSGCCNEGMMGCHDGMGQCNEGMGQCHDGMSECHEGMGECKDGKDGGTCPMMKGGMKDSVKKK
jgi:hypothetical protein